jgi:hypothetical protein
MGPSNSREQCAINLETRGMNDNRHEKTRIHPPKAIDNIRTGRKKSEAAMKYPIFQ